MAKPRVSVGGQECEYRVWVQEGGKIGTISISIRKMSNSIYREGQF